MAVSMQGQAQAVPVQVGALPGAVAPGLRWSEVGFLLLLGVALVGVFLSGRFAYREASLFQQAKDNGQALLHWASAVAATQEGKGALAPSVCQRAAAAPSAQAEPASLNWGACREQLLGEQGSLSGLHNPFGARAPVFLQACERGHYSDRGAIVVEKGTPSPPGFPPSIGYGPLEDEEAVVRGLLLRVLVCDPSGYGVRVGEVKL